MKQPFLPAFATLGAAALMLAFFNPAHAQVAQAPQDALDLKADAQSPDAPPVPPELQTLVDTFVAAFKAKNEAGMDACWHSPEALAAAPRGTAPAASTAPVLAQDREVLVKRNANDAADMKVRAAQLHTIITRYFGAPEQIKLVRVELSRGAAATTANEATYDDVKLHFLAGGSTHLVMSIDDVVKIGGVWKFRGRLKDQLTIVLPASI